MMKEKLLKWLRAAGVRALKTVAQTAVATIGTGAVISEVDWRMVLSASILAGVLSLLTGPDRRGDGPRVGVNHCVGLDGRAGDCGACRRAVAAHQRRRFAGSGQSCKRISGERRTGTRPVRRFLRGKPYISGAKMRSTSRAMRRRPLASHSSGVIWWQRAMVSRKSRFTSNTDPPP